MKSFRLMLKTAVIATFINATKTKYTADKMNIWLLTANTIAIGSTSREADLMLLANSGSAVLDNALSII